MTESSPAQDTPQAGIAQAVGDLSEQTRNLVRQEINIAQREMRDKAVQSLPAIALAAAAAFFGLLTVASAYRLSVRLLEKRMSPAGAALAATLAYGAAAGGSGVLAAQQIRKLPSLFPAETARQTSEAVADASDAVADAADKAGAAAESE